MERFGSDKPDLRFGFELKDLTEIAGKLWFINVFKFEQQQLFSKSYKPDGYSHKF